MSLNLPKNIIRYFKKISPLEIQIDKEEIFLRSKYDDIINYIKICVSEGGNEELYKIIKPSGKLLINVNPGSDIVDYIKLIAKNFQLGILVLDETTIQNNVEQFLSDLSNFRIEEEKVETETPSEEVDEKTEDNARFWILLIEQKGILNEVFKETNALRKFLENFSSVFIPINFLEYNSVFIWICYNFVELPLVSNEIFEFFDLLVNVPILSDLERENYLRSLLEKYSNISFDLHRIVEITQNWEVLDIRNFVRIGILKHFINSDLNAKSNEISEALIMTLDDNEFIPSMKPFQHGSEYLSSRGDFQNSQKWETQEDFKGKRQSILEEIDQERYSDFMEDQLYESAASKNYNELVLIIDKLTNKEVLEENDRKILSEYPFILNESPEKAQLKLEKGKKRIEQIKQFFEKK